MPVRLDLNSPKSQKQWFALEKEDRLAVLDWAAPYRDKGLRWK